ncbi:MAG TPA: class B sortase [Clostridiales bacterium]|nr:class B sortase [Clostridiales bacterium]
MNSKILYVIQLILLIIFNLNGIKIYKYTQNLKQTNDIEISSRELIDNMSQYEYIYNEVMDDKVLNEHDEEEIIKQKNKISKDLINKLTEEYPDAIGHIHIENTSIYYPIVQTDDNEFYLTHSPKKDKNANGSIFLSYLNNPDFSDDNTVIYGHNIKSGKLFQNLHKFKDQEFYDKVNTIDVHTNEGHKVYKIFSVYSTDPNYQYKYTNFNTYDDKLDFINEVIDKSIIISDNDVDEHSKIITLSTCGSNGNKRLVVHGAEI